MRSTSPRRWSAVVSAMSLALVATASAAAAAGPADDLTYEQLELQARTNLLANDEGYNLPPGSSFNSISPHINEDADVVFRVQYTADEDPTIGRPGVWFGGDGEGGIIHTGDVNWMIPNDPSINDQGDIAFTLSSGSVANKLYVYEADTGEARRVGTAPILPEGYRQPGIDNEGRIAFMASYSEGHAYGAFIDGEGVVYASDNRVDPDSPYTYLYQPSSNNNAQIAAKVATSDDRRSELEIRLFEPDGTSQLLLANQEVDPDSPYETFDNGLAVNDEGVVAILATRADTGRKVVVRTDGTTTTEIAAIEDDGPILGLDYFNPAINSSGLVAFRAVDEDGQAIYVGDGESLVRVAGQGDVVETDLGTAQLGQHDASPVFGGGPGINDHGDVVFTAGVHPEGDRLEEWGTGVFVAYAGEDDGSGEEPSSASQDIVVSVPEGTGQGSLVISVDPDDRTVQLPEMEDAGDRLSTEGELRPVTVTDSRESNPGWDVSAQVSDFSSPSDSFGAELLGWTPLVSSSAEGQTVTAGDPVESGLTDGDGLSVPRGLASAEPGAGAGTAQLGADLQLQVPLTTPAGEYRAVLTITAI